MAGRLRTYHEVGGEDRSQLLDQVVEQRARVEERLRAVRRVVAVMSGKGGVGKSYITAGLAVALVDRLSCALGVLDADLHGPTAARLLDAQGPVEVVEKAVVPVTSQHGIKVFSMDLLLEEGQPLRWKEPGADQFVWRGTLETGAVREFLSDVEWGTLDLLLVDLPPGAQHMRDLTQLVPELGGVVAVTIPSEESRRSVARAIREAREAGARLLGVIENMSGYLCAGCSKSQPLFPGDAGAALAQEFGIPLLGKLPFVSNAADAAHRAHAAQELPTELVHRFLEALP